VKVIANAVATSIDVTARGTPQAKPGARQRQIELEDLVLGNEETRSLLVLLRLANWLSCRDKHPGFDFRCTK
jgi:hypothetical protein